MAWRCIDPQFVAAVRWLRLLVLAGVLRVSHVTPKPSVSSDVTSLVTSHHCASLLLLNIQAPRQP